ncbi:MAG: cytochrome C, partial [Desulforhopalus sp.]|nr:cytochrome C [Desulforhopalus sp.]
MRNKFFFIIIGSLIISCFSVPKPTSAIYMSIDDYESTYVGSLACKECHPEEYENFVTYAKKSVSFQSIERRMKHLTPEEIRQCYPCHTTGYGQPSGFINLEETPHLKNAGCEVCHGPGAEHVKTGDP